MVSYSGRIARLTVDADTTQFLLASLLHDSKATSRLAVLTDIDMTETAVLV